MQLLCNGVILDLYDNAGLQFTHENPLFAFDDLKCERTTNFKLPATPTNDRVFSLAKIPAYSGEGMRRKFPCQLQTGTVVRDGYLYVANFDGKDYNAVFVTGELVGLQRIKDLGKLADIADWAWAIRSGYDVYDASAATFKTFMFSAYRYHTPTGVSVMPSINLGKLAEYACTQNNVPVTIPEKAYDMRIALSELKTPEDAAAHIFSQKETSDEWYNSIEPDGFIKYLTENHGLVALKTVTYHSGHNNPQGEVLQTDETRKMVEHYRCPNDISITFPADFPDNYFLVYMNPLVTGQCVFLGDYSFTRSISGIGEGTYTTTGEPLAGRTIDIPANTSFILIRTIVEGDVSKSDYACRAENTYIYIDDEPVAVTAVTRGWEFAQADALAYDIEVQVSTSSENAGEWRLQDNLPDITLTELLKAIAAELGYILNYTEADGIIFDTIDTDAVTVKSLDTLTKKGEVVRTFGKYAQHNYVQFADDEQFQNVQFTAVDYTIDNDNLSNDKTLLKLPWTCGVQDAQYVRDKAGRTKPLEIRFNPEEFGIYALFAKIEKNADIQNLCDQSTQIKIEARMPLLQYDAIKPKTGLLVDGSTYLWTERSWQKDVAKMTLAQYAKAIVPPEPPAPTPSVYEIWYTTTNNQPVMSSDGFVWGNTLISNVFDGEKCIATYANPITNINTRGFYGLATLTSVTLPDSVSAISSYAFFGCSELVTINLPNIISRIEVSTFERCEKLVLDKLPLSLSFIGTSAFERCLAIPVAIDIPPLVTVIQAKAFTVTYIRDFTIKNTTAKITGGANMFTGGSSCTVRVPNSLLSQYQADGNWNVYNLVGY